MDDAAPDVSFVKYSAGTAFEESVWKESGRKLFTCFTVNGYEYSLGDFAQLNGGETDDAVPFLVRVIRFYCDEDPQINDQMVYMYMWRPSDLMEQAQVAAPADVGDRELFMAFNEEDPLEGNLIFFQDFLSCIEGKPKIVCTSLDPRNPQPSEADVAQADYVYRRAINLATKQFEPVEAAFDYYQRMINHRFPGLLDKNSKKATAADLIFNKPGSVRVAGGYPKPGVSIAKQEPKQEAKEERVEEEGAGGRGGLDATGSGRQGGGGEEGREGAQWIKEERIEGEEARSEGMDAGHERTPKLEMEEDFGSHPNMPCLAHPDGPPIEPNDGRMGSEGPFGAGAPWQGEQEDVEEGQRRTGERPDHTGGAQAPTRKAGKRKEMGAPSAAQVGTSSRGRGDASTDKAKKKGKGKGKEKEKEAGMEETEKVKGAKQRARAEAGPGAGAGAEPPQSEAQGAAQASSRAGEPEADWGSTRNAGTEPRGPKGPFAANGLQSGSSQIKPWGVPIPKWEDAVASAVKQSRVLRIDGLEPGTLSQDLEAWQEALCEVFPGLQQVRVQPWLHSVPPSQFPAASVHAYAIFRLRDQARDAEQQLLKGRFFLAPAGRPITGSVVPPDYVSPAVAVQRQLQRAQLQQAGGAQDGGEGEVAPVFTRSLGPGFLFKRNTRGEDMKETVATSHCAQPNTMEFDFGVQWRAMQLQDREDLLALLQEQSEELKEGKARD